MEGNEKTFSECDLVRTRERHSQRQGGLGRSLGQGWGRGVPSDSPSAGLEPPLLAQSMGQAERAGFLSKHKCHPSLPSGSQPREQLGLASRGAGRGGGERASCVCWWLCSSAGSRHSGFKDNIRCLGTRGAGVLWDQTLQMREQVSKAARQRCVLSGYCFLPPASTPGQRHPSRPSLECAGLIWDFPPGAELGSAFPVRGAGLWHGEGYEARSRASLLETPSTTISAGMLLKVLGEVSGAESGGGSSTPCRVPWEARADPTRSSHCAPGPLQPTPCCPPSPVSLLLRAAAKEINIHLEASASPSPSGRPGPMAPLLSEVLNPPPPGPGGGAGSRNPGSKI